MSTLQDVTIPLMPGYSYHIFNRGNNGNLIFYQEKNYKYFLEKYFESMRGFVETYAYCLIENHFHLFLKLRSKEKILETAFEKIKCVDQNFYKTYINFLSVDDESRIDKLNIKNLMNVFIDSQHSSVKYEPNHHPVSLHELSLDLKICSWAVSEQLRRFLLGYAKAINKQENKTGSLFQKPFKRKYIYGDDDRKILLSYILHNPIHHGYVQHMSEYPRSSYHELLNCESPRINRSEVISWFNGKENLQLFLINYVEQYHLFHME
jgi:putative transposase